jgi:hypothetical protein
MLPYHLSEDRETASWPSNRRQSGPARHFVLSNDRTAWYWLPLFQLFYFKYRKIQDI